MTQEIPAEAVRINAFQEGGLFIPNSILSNHALTFLEKLLYSHILCLNVNGKGCFQSTEYIATKLGASPSSVKRSIYNLVKIGALKRVQTGGNGVMRQLYCCDFVSDRTIRAYSLDQNDPASEGVSGIKLIPTEDQNDPDKKPSYNNIRSNRGSDQNDPESDLNIIDPLLSESKTGITLPAPAAPSPKVPAKGSPRPDESSPLIMTDRDWNRFVDDVGLECALFVCEQVIDWAERCPKKFAEKKNHYRFVMNWYRRAIAEGHVFGLVKGAGYGFYKPWVTGLKAMGKA